MGILMAPQCVYVLYNTGNGVLKWEYRTEVRLNAFLQHYLQGYPYNGHPQIRAIMTGTDMEMAFRLFTSTGGYKKSLFYAGHLLQTFPLPSQYSGRGKCF